MSDTAFSEIYLDFANSCDTHCPYIIVKYSCIVNLDLTFLIVLTNYMCSDGWFKSLYIYLLSHFMVRLRREGSFMRPETKVFTQMSINVPQDSNMWDLPCA